MASNDINRKSFDIPDYLLTELRNIFNRYSEHSTNVGYKRLKGLIMNKIIGYSQMKRIKNYFDNYSGDRGDIDYLLNGGPQMEDWVNSQLTEERGKIEDEKHIRKDNGELNQFRKAHTKTKKTINRDYLLNKFVSEGEIDRIKFLLNNIK